MNMCRLYLVLYVTLDIKKNKKKSPYEVFDTSTHTIKFSLTGVRMGESVRNTHTYITLRNHTCICTHR